MKLGLAPLLVLASLSLGVGCAAPTADNTDESADDLLDAQPLGATPSGHRTSHPIVLAHGFNGSPTNGWAFFGVAEALRKDGHVVHVASVPPFDSAAVRAKALAVHVDQAIAECKLVHGC